MPQNVKNIIKRVLLSLVALFLFFLAIDLMGQSFRLLSKEAVESILAATSNPFVGLFIGLLITALIQSSSTSTSMIVAIVASGSITIGDAVPMIMGANIGTTLTSTIVSLGFITKKNEFRRAISAGVVHDFVNILTVLLLFPLEIQYGILSHLAQWITDNLSHAYFTKWIPNLNLGFELFHPISKLFVSWLPHPFLLLIIAFVLLFGCIKIFANFISKALMGDNKEKLQQMLFQSPVKSMLVGLGTTSVIQSSSVTTSLIVPFVATNRVSLRQAFNFILGANIGTTLTALLAALFKSEAAITVALVHVLFNLIVLLLFFPFRFMQNIPIRMAKWFGRLTNKYRLAGFIYILMTFFLVPFLLIYFNKETSTITEFTYIQHDYAHQEESYKQIISKGTEHNNLNRWLVYEGMKQQDLNNEAPTKIFDVYKRGNLLFLNNQLFILGKEGYCWDNEDKFGKYRICLTDIQYNYHSRIQDFDSVYVYSKIYTDSLKAPFCNQVFYVQPVDKIMVKMEKFDSAHHLLYSEDLIRLQHK